MAESNGLKWTVDEVTGEHRAASKWHDEGDPFMYVIKPPKKRRTWFELSFETIKPQRHDTLTGAKDAAEQSEKAEQPAKKSK